VTIHGREEMDADALSVFDAEHCILTGEVVERQRDYRTGSDSSSLWMAVPPLMRQAAQRGLTRDVRSAEPLGHILDVERVTARALKQVDVVGRTEESAAKVRCS